MSLHRFSFRVLKILTRFCLLFNLLWLFEHTVLVLENGLNLTDLVVLEPFFEFRLSFL